MVKLLLLLSTLLLTACGYRAGDYAPVLMSDARQGSNWDADLAACHGEVLKVGGGRAKYGPALDECMAVRGHEIDRDASAKKFAEVEKERKRKDAEIAKKASGY